MNILIALVFAIIFGAICRNAYAGAIFYGLVLTWLLMFIPDKSDD